MRTYISSALAGALVLGLATATLAATKGEFDNMCTQGLAMGKDVQTDCSVNATIAGQDLLLRQRRCQGRLYEGPRGQSREGAGLLLEEASWVSRSNTAETNKALPSSVEGLLLSEVAKPRLGRKWASSIFGSRRLRHTRPRIRSRMSGRRSPGARRPTVGIPSL